MDGMRGPVLFTIDGHKTNTERTHSENQWRIVRVLARTEPDSRLPTVRYK